MPQAWRLPDLRKLHLNMRQSAWLNFLLVVPANAIQTAFMRYLFLLFSLCWMSPILAQAGDALPTGTRINLNATAETQLANDEVVISFRVEKDGKDAGAVRQYVNRVSGAIQKRLQQEPGVKLKTLSRSMQPVWQYPKNRQRIRTGWRMTQTGQVVSSQLDAVPKWLDGIESAGANLSGLQFRISSKASKKAQDQLRLQAIASFRQKARLIAKGLSANSFRIIQLNSSSQAPRPVMYRGEMAMMAKSADAAPPSLSAGEGKISVSVSGTIQVPFTDFPVK